MPVLLVSAIGRSWKITKSRRLENFMEELGVYDGEIDSGDPRWSIACPCLPHKGENGKTVSYAFVNFI